MKAKLTFGKVDYLHQGRKNCPVEINIELRNRGGDPTFTIDPETKEEIYTGKKTPEYVELSICGEIWNHNKTDCYACGQCLDTIAKYVKAPLFKELHGYWKKYHLNGMNAGTPEQEKAVEEWKAAGNRYDYTAACEMLKEKGLYEVNFTGATTGRYYKNEPYRYGSGWVVEEIPGDVLLRIEHIITAANNNKI